MEENINKQNFLKWLLLTYKHSDPSVNFLIDFLASNPNILKLVRFSDAAKYAPRGLYISYKVQERHPFIYYKDNHSYSQSEQAFHDIRLNAFRLTEPIFIEVDIPEKYQEMYRFDVFEENPYIPRDNAVEEGIQQMLDNYSYEGRLKYLKDCLDRSLESQNYEESEYYLNQIQQLKGERH